MTTPQDARQPIVIDRLTAQAAQAMLKQEVSAGADSRKVGYAPLERFSTNGLGVLQEQGVYAIILYLLANSGNKTDSTVRKEDNISYFVSEDQLAICTILHHLLKLLPQFGLPKDELPGEEQQDPAALNGQKQILLDYFAKNISSNLNSLLLVKNAFSQTLTYLRYGAKALKEDKA